MAAVYVQVAFVVVVVTHVLILQAKVLKPDVPQCNKKVDLAVLLDSSASVGDATYQLTKKFARCLIKRFSFGKNMSRFSIMSYSFYIHIPIRFKDFNKSGSFERTLDSLTWEGSMSFTDRALQAARYEMFSPKYGSRPQQKDVKRVAILFTDGQSTNGRKESSSFAKPLKQMGIEIFVVALGDHVAEKEVPIIASDPMDVFYFAHNQGRDNLLNDLVNAVCK